jgi:hypothetical protein
MFLKVVGGPQTIGWYGMGVFEISRFFRCIFPEHGVVVLGDNPTPYWPMDLPIKGDSPIDGHNLTYLSQDIMVCSHES